MVLFLGHKSKDCLYCLSSNIFDISLPKTVGCFMLNAFVCSILVRSKIYKKKYGMTINVTSAKNIDHLYIAKVKKTEPIETKMSPYLGDCQCCSLLCFKNISRNCPVKRHRPDKHTSLKCTPYHFTGLRNMSGLPE